MAVSRLAEHPDRFSIERVDGTRARLYTYKATVERVIDGDTLLVRIDLGFRTTIQERVRLRGIDEPEMSTAEGKRTRDYVKATLGDPGVVDLGAIQQQRLNTKDAVAKREEP